MKGNHIGKCLTHMDTQMVKQFFILFWIDKELILMHMQMFTSKQYIVNVGSTFLIMILNSSIISIIGIWFFLLRSKSKEQKSLSS